MYVQKIMYITFKVLLHKELIYRYTKEHYFWYWLYCGVWKKLANFLCLSSSFSNLYFLKVIFICYLNVTNNLRCWRVSKTFMLAYYVFASPVCDYVCHFRKISYTGTNLYHSGYSSIFSWFWGCNSTWCWP